MKIYSIILSLVLLLLIFTFLPDFVHLESLNNETKEFLNTVVQSESGSENIVTAVYLQTRVFDTIFETLLLLVSITGVSHFSKGKGSKKW